VGEVTIDVRRASVEEIRPLRETVLRPGLPAEASVYPQDQDAVHVGAWNAGDLVGCATVFPEPWPGPPEVVDAWRLRGMAVSPDLQGRGIGRQVLAAAVRAAAESGAPLLWANARSTALAFYMKEGWQVVGAEFVTNDTGLQHRKIVREVTNA
jgi:GNAT superfamily N-acetyltransferase